ncbi:MAG: hypothetical protein NE328_14515 [Lentisphaeraceae bacterium]|nr:hypothetical protein [Lentisphaeraceae bacterium]
MAIKYSYSIEENTVRVEAAGVLTINEIEAYVKAIIEDETIQDGFIEIFNLKGVQDFDFTFEAGKKISSLYSKLMMDKHFRGAVHITPKDIHYGISHILSAILEDISIVFTIRGKSEMALALQQF